MKVIYNAIALHPILKDAQGITFSKEQLQAYGHTLSNRSLTVNHATIPREVFQKHPYAKILPYPENRTGTFAYDSRYDGLFGTIEISDNNTDCAIFTGGLSSLSVESKTWPLGRIEFTGLSLLTHDLPPRDPLARVIRESRRIVLEL